MVCTLITPHLILDENIKAYLIALCWEYGLTLLASDLPSSSYRWFIIVMWFRIEAMAALLPRRGNNICQGCWLIPHFNASVSGLNLKVTFCGEVKLWKGARAGIFVLHLRANHHLCHYITTHNGFTDEQHNILPAEICKMFFFLYSDGISVKLTRALMSQNLHCSKSKRSFKTSTWTKLL